MKKSLLETYALAVCFVTVTCFAVAFGVGAYDIIEIKKPQFTLSAYEHERYLSNEAFTKYEIPAVTPTPRDKKKESEEEITKRRLDTYQQALRIEQRNGMQSLTMTLIIMFINMVFFLIHWRIAKRARLSADAETG